jgi:hypothetical protein
VTKPLCKTNVTTLHLLYIKLPTNKITFLTLHVTITCYYCVLRHRNCHRLTNQSVFHPDPLLPTVQRTSTLRSGRSDSNRGTRGQLHHAVPTVVPLVIRSDKQPIHPVGTGEKSHRKGNLSEISGSDSGAHEDSSQDSLMMTWVCRNM